MPDKCIALDLQVADILQDAVRAALHDTFHVATEIKPWNVQREALPPDDCLIGLMAIKQGAKHYGYFVTAFDRAVIAKVLAFYGVSTMPDRTMLHDAVSEMTNVLYGMFKTEMNHLGYGFEMGLPEVIDTEWDGQNMEKLILPFIAEGHSCRIVVSNVQQQ